MKNCNYQQIDPTALPMPTPAPSRPPSRHEDQQEEEQRHPGDKRRKPRRRWQVFPGRNRFLCDGRIVTAGTSGVLPLTLGLILVTTGLFFVFDCPFLIHHISASVPVIAAVLFVFVLITLLRTTFSDPGILPRATPDEAADIEKQIDESGNASHPKPPPRAREVVINGQVVKLKYCGTCKIFRPPRTSHCGVCDNCVERFDHHCPWVGNCVGKRNYRFFFSFIVSLFFHTAFILGCVTTHIVLRAQGGKGLVFAFQESPGSAVVLLICFLSVWSIMGLLGFHTYLIASNKTTNEDIKGLWSRRRGGETVMNPYSHRNICKNCCSILCGPMPPSVIDSRGFLPEDGCVQTGAGDLLLLAVTTENHINAMQREKSGGATVLSVYDRTENFQEPRKSPEAQCTQGTKGLLESAARSPLLSSSCPQAKPQPVQPHANNHLSVNSEPPPQPTSICAPSHATMQSSPPPQTKVLASSPPQTKTRSSPPRRTKTHASKRKRHSTSNIPTSPDSEDPAPPTFADVPHQHQHHHHHHNRSKSRGVSPRH